MKRLSRILFGGLLCASVVATAVVGADEKSAREQAKESSQTLVGRADSKTSAFNIRASKLMGMNIENPQGDGVGEIKDLVLDSSTGKIRYAAVTYGGLLGIGNKLFAVPFEAFEYRLKAGTTDEHVLVLNVTENQLKGHTGFNEDHWPNFADPSFTSDLDKRYNINAGKRRVNRDSKVDVNAGANGVDVKIRNE